MSPKLSHRLGKTILGALVTLSLAVATARADTVVLNTSQSALGPGLNQGWYDNGGNHDPFNSNTFTSGNVYRSFFIFDLSSLLGQTVTSATLSVFNSSTNTFSGSPPWTVSFYDITTNLSSVKNSTNSASTYNDLGSGVLYGTHTFSTFGSYVDFTLNASALAALNAQGTGHFGIGASLAQSTGIFGWTAGDVNYLKLETTAANVPEAGMTAPLFACAAGALVWLRRRKS